MQLLMCSGKVPQLNWLKAIFSNERDHESVSLSSASEEAAPPPLRFFVWYLTQVYPCSKFLG